MGMDSSLTSLTVSLQFVVGVIGGVIATLAMDRIMAVLPEGKTSPFVAAGVLTKTTPRAAPERLATVVHYLAGVLTGPLFVWLLFTSEGLLGSGLLTTLLAALVLYVLMVGFFAVVVLPQIDVHPDRTRTIRRDWAISAALYVAVLVPLLSVVFSLV